jgi:hypothetical protein
MDLFRSGDKVRLKAGRYLPRYNAGDIGTISAVIPEWRSGGQELYQVCVDRDKNAALPVFYADELELVA